MDRLIISDTGPVISLEKLSDGFTFIQKLYDKVILPDEVVKELSYNRYSPSSKYLHHYGIEDFMEVRPVPQISNLPEIERLDEGEKQAISLAHQMDLPLLIEETMGRRIAISGGIRISGIAGQIVRAFKENIIEMDEAQNKLQELLQAGRINRKIFQTLVTGLR